MSLNSDQTLFLGHSSHPSPSQNKVSACMCSPYRINLDNYARNDLQV